MRIKEISKEIHELNKSKGFWDKPREVGTMLMLVTSELSEALEADREDLMDDKLPHRKGIEVEVADAVIRLFDLSEGLKLDLEGAIREKVDYNKTREHKHGKKY